jgi:hypothetical protein
VLKSIIFGNVHHYWYQNSNIDDYWCIYQQFASRLEARCHVKADLIPIFKEAFTALVDAPTSNFSNNTAVPDDTLFFHTVYHPQGVSRHDIHCAFFWHSCWTLWFWSICDCIFSTTKSSWCSHPDKTFGNQRVLHIWFFINWLPENSPDNILL